MGSYWVQADEPRRLAAVVILWLEVTGFWVWNSFKTLTVQKCFLSLQSRYLQMLGQLKFSHFCDVLQRLLVFIHGLFGKPIGLIFKGQTDQEQFFLGRLIFEDGLNRKEGKHLSELFNLLKPTGHMMHQQFNPLNTKRRLLYLKTHFVPRSKHFSSPL